MIPAAPVASHRVPSPRSSLLLASSVRRVAVALVVVALIWLTTGWALGWWYMGALFKTNGECMPTDGERMSTVGERTPAIELEEVSLGWRDKVAVRELSG